MGDCKGLSFEECEEVVLQKSVDAIEKKQGKELMGEKDTKLMLKIAEDFLRKHKCVMYGGTAVNNILPKAMQFYDYRYELPDYDAYNPDALKLVKELADIYLKHFKDVEAKTGVHHNTYKVFVNQHAIVDLSYMPPELFKRISADAKTVNGLKYAPVNFLRMAMYLELSRPNGDVSRWGKVYKRLTLLNKAFPFERRKCSTSKVKFPEDLYEPTYKTLVADDVVFIGGYANKMYLQHASGANIENVTEFDVISTDPLKTCSRLMTALKDHTPTMETHEPIGSLIEKHYSISVNGQYLLFIFTPVACHSYNKLKDQKGNMVKIGTIDTLFSFYLTFLYANRPYFDEKRILCLCQTLFSIQQQHRLTRKKELQRFTMNCYGTQQTLGDMRAEKKSMYTKLTRGTPEFEEWFLQYPPHKVPAKPPKSPTPKSPPKSPTPKSPTQKSPTKPSKSPFTKKKFKRFTKKLKYFKYSDV
jgi:hypothetical protein